VACFGERPERRSLHRINALQCPCWTDRRALLNARSLSALIRRRLLANLLYRRLYIGSPMAGAIL
jgi:hypothetical protein